MLPEGAWLAPAAPCQLRHISAHWVAASLEDDDDEDELPRFFFFFFFFFSSSWG